MHTLRAWNCDNVSLPSSTSRELNVESYLRKYLPEIYFILSGEYQQTEQLYKVSSSHEENKGDGVCETASVKPLRVLT